MRVFSGIQPTGKIHIGNYLGAIKNWIELQDKNECVFSIVDLHSLTIPYQVATLQKRIMETAIIHIAAGIDPDKSIFFVQSHIKEHTELTWFLNTVCPVGQLSRMTQYKEKAKQFKRNINAGLLNYPILQAADILLYQTELVPIGQDQKQHLELAADIARKFNLRFGQTFKIPKAQIPKQGAKIMALNNPKKKMSKSVSESCLFLSDEPVEIKTKIMAAVTDTGKTIKYDPKRKPGVANLLTIYSLLNNQPIKEIEKQFSNKGYAEFKKELIRIIVDYLEPFRRKRKELVNREVYLKEILDKGAQRAQRIAQINMIEIKRKMGLTD